MKRLISIFLLLVLILQYFSKVEVFLYCQLNKNYISAFLCENKSKPEMQCNGKCYMKKQLKATDENQNKLPISIKEFQEIIFFCSQSELIFIEDNNPAQICIARLSPFDYTSPFFRIFHPPKTV